MLKKISILILIIVSFISLVACEKEKTEKSKYEGKVLNIYNWGDYIDPDVLKDFEKEYKIKINYEVFANNEEMLAKIQAGGTSYDVIFPSEYMVEAMREQKLLQPLDMSKLPNFKNIRDDLKNLSYDPLNKYSVPYFWGTMGIVYNTKKVKEKVDSWDVLWNPKYEGQIIMIDSSRDTIGITLKKLGYSLNTRNIKELEEARDALIEQKRFVKAYEVDAYKDMMVGNEAAMSIAWSGDALLLMGENEDLQYVIPKEGTNLWFDTMAIPTTSKNLDEAHLFVDYMMRPDVAAKCSEYVEYSTANKEAMKLLPKETVENEYAYPSGNIVEKGEVFEDLASFTTYYDKVWTEIKCADPKKFKKKK